MIDTLVLSGGSTSGISYIGAIQALFEQNILSKDLHGIKHIITCSAGIFFSILLIIGVNLSVIEKVNQVYDYSDMLQVKDIHIDNILLNFGIFTNEKVGDFISTFLKHTIHKDTLTLSEFYQLYKIKLTVKVCNLTTSKIEYINHETDPTMDLLLLVRMTTCIPILFKPISYNNCLYVDGGIKNGYPIEYLDSENFLGIKISSQKTIQESPIPFLNFLKSLFMCEEKTFYQDKYNQKTIHLQINNSILNFNLSEEQKKDIILQGYNQTLTHIKIHTSAFTDKIH